LINDSQLLKPLLARSKQQLAGVDYVGSDFNDSWDAMGEIYILPRELRW